MVLASSMPMRARFEPVFAQHGRENRADETVDQRALFDDGNRMNFFDPGHGAFGAVAFAAGAEKNGRLIRDQQRAVERGGFARRSVAGADR